MSARILVERLGPTPQAEAACLALGESLRWTRRHQAYALFAKKHTIAQVIEMTGFSRRTVYRYFEQWREEQRPN